MSIVNIEFLIQKLNKNCYTSDLITLENNTIHNIIFVLKSKLKK